MAKKKSRPSAGTPALLALEAAGVAHTVHHYHHDENERAYGDEAARELGVDPSRVFKTLVLDTDTEGKHLAVVVVPVTSQVDLKAAAQALGVKRVALADRQVASQRTGYVPGGISPLGQRHRLPTVVDSSITEASSVFVSGGRRGLDVELSGDDLVRMTRARLAPVASGRVG